MIEGYWVAYLTVAKGGAFPISDILLWVALANNSDSRGCWTLLNIGMKGWAEMRRISCRWMFNVSIHELEIRRSLDRPRVPLRNSSTAIHILFGIWAMLFRCCIWDLKPYCLGILSALYGTRSLPLLFLWQPRYLGFRVSVIWGPCKGSEQVGPKPKHSRVPEALHP